MKNVLFFLLLILSFNFSNANYIVPVNVWYVKNSVPQGQQPSYLPLLNWHYQSASEKICEINNYHSNNIYAGALTPTSITFYLSNVYYVQVSGSGSALRANILNKFSKSPGINIYINGTFNNVGGNSGAYAYPEDVITVATVDGVVWNHEIGHYLSLGHTCAGAPSNPPSSNCGIFQYVIPVNAGCGSWMDQGGNSGFFHPQQIGAMNNCCSTRGFGNSSTINYSPNIPDVKINSGYIYFDFPSSPSTCSNVQNPYKVDMKIVDYCMGDLSYKFKTTNNPFVPFPLSGISGLKSIEYIYYFPNSVTINIKIQYNMPPDINQPCGTLPPGSNSKIALNETKKFEISSNSSVGVELSYESFGYDKAYIRDIYGRELLDISLEKGLGLIDVSNLSSGIYYIVAFNNKEYIIRKFIKN